MKAMILAAGLGTRLLPLTKKKPKPLFPIAGRPLIDILIRRLEASGCKAVIINTHHLAEMIDQFLKGQDYGIPVQTRYEPTILGTGGAIKNVEDFWHEAPVLVVNCDIFTNIDFGQIYRFHLNHKDTATLVLHDCPPFNQVWVDEMNHIVGFGDTAPCPAGLAEVNYVTATPTLPSPLKGKGLGGGDPPPNYRKLAFTGIQVIDAKVLGFIPEGAFHSIINTYCEMIKAGMKLKGFVADNCYWYDIGTMEGYQAASREAIGRKALQRAFPTAEPAPLVWSGLKGDGSDRMWYRVSFGGGEKPLPPGQPSVVLVDHGPPAEAGTCEADAFAAIGRHLDETGVAVPRIYCYDRPTGLVVLEDLGDLNLQTVISRTGDREKVISHYRAVIDLLIFMGIEGAKGFDPAYTFQTPYYDRDLILERESKYFVTAFLNGYRDLGVEFENLKEEFELLAESALKTGNNGFLHRDFQSRNILVRNRKYYVIDFQGGRLGPLQYDLASLLIDPYVELPEGLQETLLTYYLSKLSEFVPIDRPDFLHAYKYCAINRNLQILGAFAFLSRVKGKKDFEAYIPPAVRTLKQNLQKVDPQACKQLRRIIEGL